MSPTLNIYKLQLACVLEVCSVIEYLPISQAQQVGPTIFFDRVNMCCLKSWPQDNPWVIQ